MVVFDTSFLVLVLSESARASVPNARQRVEHLIDTLSTLEEKIIIPTPALSECLVHAGPAGPDYIAMINRQGCFRIVGFDQRAAIEAAARIYEARQRGQRRGGNPDASRAKVKFDRQIVAIAKVEGASAVYSDDGDVIVYAREAGLDAFRLCDLPDPPENPQRTLPFDPDEKGA